MSDKTKLKFDLEYIAWAESNYHDVEAPSYEYWLETTLQSERALRIEAEKKLHELQDAVEYRRHNKEFSKQEKENGLEIYVKLGEADKIINQAIEESRKRREKK